MPKKLQIPSSRLKTTKAATKRLAAWNKYAEKRIKDAQRSRISDIKVRINT